MDIDLQPYSDNASFLRDIPRLIDLRISTYCSSALEFYEDGRYRFRNTAAHIHDLLRTPGDEPDFRLSDGYTEGAEQVRSLWGRIQNRLSESGGAWIPFVRAMRAGEWDGFTTHCVMLSLALELDGKYERVFGLLRDDLSLCLPSLGLAERLYEQSLDKPCAAYRQDERFTRLFEDTDEARSSGLSQGLKLEAQMRAFLLSEHPCSPPERPLFDGLARRISRGSKWDSLILPSDTKCRLEQACRHVRHASIVYESWGFGGLSGAARGVSMLFSGPPGTGKTLAASVLASELGRELYRVDFPAIVSKYIGETEKNLKTIFDGANNDHAVLLFDEADALFGKRTEIKDAHDRNANLEVSYILQRMDEFDGVLILTTNYMRNIDEAFRRRLGFIVDFPWPDKDCRVMLWEAAFPAGAPIGPDFDASTLSSVELSGSAIRNAAVAAAFLAAAEQSSITMAHITEALRSELTKHGKTLTYDQLL